MQDTKMFNIFNYSAIHTIIDSMKFTLISWIRSHSSRN